MSSRRLACLLTLTLALAALLTLGAAPSLAGQAHVFTGSFGSAGEGAGQFDPENASSAFGKTVGLAVDQSSGDVYVPDEVDNRVEKFGPAGEFILTFGKEVDSTKVESSAPEAEQNLCTAASGDTCQAGSAGSAAGALSDPAFVAVDASDGDVYVASIRSDPKQIAKYDSSGRPLASWGTNGQIVPFPSPSAEFGGIAVGPTGTLYALEIATNTMFEFTADGNLAAEVPTEFETSPLGIAVDSAGDIYKVRGGGGVAELDPSGQAIDGEVGGCPERCGVTAIGLDPSSGELYVAHLGYVSRYGPTGATLEASFGEGHLTGAAGVAVDSAGGRVYVPDLGSSSVGFFDPRAVPDATTGPASAIAEATATVEGTLAPAGGGEVSDCSFQYVSDGEFQEHRFAGAANAPCSPPPPYLAEANVSAQLTGLVVSTTYHYRLVAEDAGGQVLAQDLSFHTPFTPTVQAQSAQVTGESSATLTGTINPQDSETTYRFEYATDPAGPFAQTGVQVLPFEDEEEHPVEAALSGLNPDTTYYWRLTATNHAGSATSPQPGGQTNSSFETTGAPTAETFPVHSFGGEDLRAIGAVDPHGFDSHYRFEYVGQEQFESSGFAAARVTAEGEVPAAQGPTVVAADLPGLEPGESYRYRLVATSSAAGTPEVAADEEALSVPIIPTTGAAQACPNEPLRTGVAAHLPDCRAYEQVTPVSKGAAQDIYVGQATPTVVARSGERVIVEAKSKFGPEVEAGLTSDYMFSRSASGWSMSTPTPQPQSADDTVLMSHFLTPDLGSALFSSGWSSTLANGSDEVALSAGPFSGTHALAGVFASRPGTAGIRDAESHEWEAQSRDGGTAVLATLDREVTGHPTATTENQDLYEFAGGALHQLNVTTAGATLGSCGAAIAYGLEADGQGDPGQNGPAIGSINSVSADGSRIFFYAGAPGACPSGAELTDSGSAGHWDHQASEAKVDLYMRVDGTETVDIGAYHFDGADPEGTHLLLSRVGGGSVEFLRYETATGGLTPLISVAGPAGLAASEVISRGLLSEDGNVLYFLTPARLTPEAAGPGSGGFGNLYRLDLETDGLSYLGQSLPGQQGEYTSPDGAFYYWTTAEVPGVAGTAAGKEQAFRYDSREALVQCVSCASPFDPEPRGANIFIPSSLDGGGVARPSPLIMPASSDGDYVFFSAISELVPSDVNGEGTDPNAGLGGASNIPSADVYEWRRPGVDRCAHLQGCLALITGGADDNPHGSEFLGTDPSGRDAFFATHSRLLPSDVDTFGDLYDARIDGGFAEPAKPVECEGDACSHPLAAPEDVTPSSESFHGAGNEHPSRHHRHKPRKHHHGHKKGKHKKGKKAGSHRGRHGRARDERRGAR